MCDEDKEADEEKEEADEEKEEAEKEENSPGLRYTSLAFKHCPEGLVNSLVQRLAHATVPF